MSKKLKELEGWRRLAAEIQARSEQTAKEIREGFCDRAIVFLDVVGSTEFKAEYQDTPDVWILRVSQFSEVLAKAVEDQNGQVVKYIGDEVMATFEDPNDAASLILRVAEIEARLKQATEFPTRIKVAADFGSVYELEFDGHEPKDPQGSPVDRCARIGKYCQPGEVLASRSFKEKTDSFKWFLLGEVEMKGLGAQEVWQFARDNVVLLETVEVPKARLEALEVAERALEVALEKNAKLAARVEALGEVPDPKVLVDEGGEEQVFSEFGALVDNFRDSIRRGVPSEVTELLYQETRGSEPHFNDFDEDLTRVAENGWVEIDADTGYVALRYAHPRMRAIEATLSELKEWLSESPEGFDEWHFDTFGVEGKLALRPFWAEHFWL